MGRIQVKLSDLIAEIERRAKSDHCVQMTWLLQWVKARRPTKTEYDKARYAARKALECPATTKIRRVGKKSKKG